MQKTKALEQLGFEKLALAELEAPEDPEEAKDIQEEFYPE